MFRVISVFGAMLMCLFLIAPVNASEEITVEKKDGKFQGTITGRGTQRGFIRDVELRFVWSGIFDQPTEYYVFEWNRNPSYNMGGNISRNSLEKYPDLLRRYDALRPSNVKLKMDVEYNASRGRYDQCELGRSRSAYPNPGYVCNGTLSKTITQTPHLMIERSGRRGDNITATSPKDNWFGFFDHDRYTRYSNERNRQLQNLMKRSERLEVSDLRIEYDAPTSQLRSIANEYSKRESKAQQERNVAEMKSRMKTLEAEEKTTGQTNTKILAEKINTYNKLGQYEKAKQSLDKFRRLQPTQDRQKEIATASINIENQVAARREARLKKEAAERAVRLQTEADARKAKRLAPFIEAENAKKRQFLSRNKFTGTKHLSKKGGKGLKGRDGKRGAFGSSPSPARNFNRTYCFECRNPPGGTGGTGTSGGSGSSGKNAGNIYLTIVEEPMKYTAPFGLVAVKSAKGAILSEGYWDFSKPLIINLSGGVGGQGGSGGGGGGAGFGANGSYDGDRYARAGKGGNGGRGGDGGNGGKGGDGGKATITLVGGSDFVSKIKPRLSINVKGGIGGKGGTDGGGGYAGDGGRHANGTKAPDGRRGPAGDDGRPGKQGKKGRVIYKQVSLANFEAQNPSRKTVNPKSKTKPVPQTPALTGKEKYLSECDGGKASSCGRLGYMFDTGKGAEKNQAQARVYYKKGCDRGHAISCGNLGLLNYKGRGGPQDLVLSRALYTRACDDGAMGRCLTLASMLARGQGGPKNLVVAESYYEKGIVYHKKECDDGDASDCYLVAESLRQKSGCCGDKRPAIVYFTKGCNGGHAKSCSPAGRLLDANFGGSNFFQKKIDLFKKGCDLGDSDSCDTYTYYLKGVKLTEEKVQSCEAGVAKDCSFVGDRYLVGRAAEKNIVKARQFFEKSCDLGHASGCTELANTYKYDRDNHGGELSQVQFKKWTERACDLGNSGACKKIGQ